ncbi:hypothetical protein [Lacrimispora brassicae]
MDKLIPVFIVIGIIILGFIMKLIELNDIRKKIEFTNNYRNKFISLLNGIISDKNFNQQLYYELTSDVNSMQYELGSDGIYAHVTDNLKGFSTSNYQLLVNFLPEIRNILSEQDNIIIMNRYNQSAGDCDDMFIRHLGTLSEIDNSIRKNLFNPFSCFSGGMKFVVSLPILLLNWFGFISDERTRKAKHSWLVKLLNFVVTFVGLISAVMSVVMGWSEFWKKLYDIF